MSGPEKWWGKLGMLKAETGPLTKSSKATPLKPERRYLVILLPFFVFLFFHSIVIS
jgi:hypothetical protein